jgi:hypothetical protein
MSPNSSDLRQEKKMIDYFNKWQGVADTAQQTGNGALELWASLALVAPFALIAGALIVGGYFLKEWLSDNYYI